MANKKQYYYISAWGYIMNSMTYYVKQEIKKAQEEDAPDDAIYRNNDGKWITHSGIKDEATKKYVQKIVYEKKGNKAREVFEEAGLEIVDDSDDE